MYTEEYILKAVLVFETPLLDFFSFALLLEYITHSLREECNIMTNEYSCHLLGKLSSVQHCENRKNRLGEREHQDLKFRL